MVKKGFGSKPVTIKELGEFTEQVILPGVEGIVERTIEEKVRPIVVDVIKPMQEEMRKGFADISKSIQVLGGDIAELKEREKDQKHEERIGFLERKAAAH